MRVCLSRVHARSVVSLLFATVSLWSQPEVAVIHGKVVDSSTSQPVVGARVIVARFDRPGELLIRQALETEASDEVDSKADRAAVITPDDGTFRFVLEAPIDFYLFVDAPGYVKPFKGISPENTYQIKSQGPQSEILIRLTPELSMSGQVIDSESNKPIPHFSVRAHSYRLAGPGRALVVAGESRSDEAGLFSIQGLPPGEYYLEVLAPLGAKISAPRSKKDFPDEITTAYVTAWYPGVDKAEVATPVPLWSGSGPTDLQVRLRKTRVASVRGRILGDEHVAEGGEAQLSLLRVDRTLVGVSQSVVARGSCRINSVFQIDGIAAGSYWLAASAQGVQRQTAVLAVDMADENKEGVDIFLSNGISVAGRVLLQGDDRKRDTSGPRIDKMRVVLRPLLRLLPDSNPLSALVNGKDGRFMFRDVPADKYHVRLSGSSPGFDIKEVRYNGSIVNHGIVTFGNALDHRVDVVLAPATSTITVSAKDGTDAAPGARILLIQEPVDDNLFLLGGLGFREKVADKDGKVEFLHLLPGRYRITAFADGVLWADDPNLRYLVAAGELVTLAEAQLATVDLRVQSARH